MDTESLKDLKGSLTQQSQFRSGVIVENNLTFNINLQGVFFLKTNHQAVLPFEH